MYCHAEVAFSRVHAGSGPCVRVVDFGIRGIDLTYALADGCDVAVLIDAASRGQPPGALYVIEPRVAAGAAPPPSPAMFTSPLLDAHSMDPVKVLAAVAAMGGGPGRVFLVGCEPAPAAADEMQMGMSDPVRAVVEEAVSLVESLVARVLARSPPAGPAGEPFAAGGAAVERA